MYNHSFLFSGIVSSLVRRNNSGLKDLYFKLTPSAQYTIRTEAQIPAYFVTVVIFMHCSYNDYPLSQSEISDRIIYLFV